MYGGWTTVSGKYIPQPGMCRKAEVFVLLQDTETCSNFDVDSCVDLHGSHADVGAAGLLLSATLGWSARGGTTRMS